MDAIDLLELLRHKLFQDHTEWSGLTKSDFNSAIKEIESLYSQLEEKK